MRRILRNAGLFTSKQGGIKAHCMLRRLRERLWSRRTTRESRTRSRSCSLSASHSATECRSTGAVCGALVSKGCCRLLFLRLATLTFGTPPLYCYASTGGVLLRSPPSAVATAFLQRHSSAQSSRCGLSCIKYIYWHFQQCQAYAFFIISRQTGVSSFTDGTACCNVQCEFIWAR